MSRDHNDIYSIVERLRILEEGLDKDQRSVNQLGATFKPKTVAVLTAKTDPKNPMAGKLVGGSESVERDTSVLEADMAEDVLDKVQKSFQDFLHQIEQIKDTDLKDKKKDDGGIKKKDAKDRGLKAKKNEETDEAYDMDQLSKDAEASLKSSLDKQSDDRIAKLKQGSKPFMAQVGDKIIGGIKGAAKGFAGVTEEGELASALSGTIPAAQPAGEPGVSIKESVPIKTVTLMDGIMCEIHGNERDGFEIRRAGRSLPTRFRDMAQAEMAVEMYQARKKKALEAEDYLEEQ